MINSIGDRPARAQHRAESPPDATLWPVPALVNFWPREKDSIRAARQPPADRTKPLVYFARAIDGLDASSIRSNGRKVGKYLASYGLAMIDPYESLRATSDSAGREATPQELVSSDLRLLAHSDAVLMNMSIPNRNYIGCVAELVYAHLWRVPAVVYVGASLNDQRPWLQYHATVICTKLPEAVKQLRKTLKMYDTGYSPTQ